MATQRPGRLNLLAIALAALASAQLIRVFISPALPQAHRPSRQKGSALSLEAVRADLRDEWIDIQGAKASFGATTPFTVALAGPLDLAEDWLFGGAQDDSVDRLVQAGKPAFSKIERVKELEISGSGKQVYKFSLPDLDLMGLGKATSSINLFGAIREDARGKFLEIGTFGNPKAKIGFATGLDIDLPVFSLNVTGELRIAQDGRSERQSLAVGSVSIAVKGEVPSLAGVTLPEQVLKAAAQEANRQTCAYASRKLELELSQDFAAWRGQKVRMERR
ncbi:unnamed protein product [Effrenium voratum]|nr:unnamed protein product [Effrenium voratum]